jgi:acyl-CoA-binding protein
MATTKKTAADSGKSAAKSGAKSASTPKPVAAKADAGGDLKTRFEAAAAAAKQTKQRPDNATMLKLYSYYKQATEGDARGERPGGFDFVGGAKYDAWAKLKGVSRDDAMTNYIKQVERLNRQ